MIALCLNLQRYFVKAGLCIILVTSPAIAGENSQPDNSSSDQETNNNQSSNSVLAIDDTVLQELEEDERQWYRRFQEGVMFFDGWSEISGELLEAYPREQIADRTPIIQRLGIKIGTEWCKDNEIRKIDTPMLQSWGKRLRESIKRGHDIITQTLLEIEGEVDMLLKKGDKVTLVAPQS
jgi:hypothetical protein